ncbi:uncharacterized protein LOC135211225 isoform X1 [Macrobrachium nipponense]|uniref:uncharacterized protein LOC135211225 isoform X1 n=1 Tax=Macrobrachium nipponense TaxID=159736 RepID=UPI0030C7B44F
MHDVERYRGPCLIVAKPGNSGGVSPPHGGGGGGGQGQGGGRARRHPSQDGTPHCRPAGGGKTASGGSQRHSTSGGTMHHAHGGAGGGPSGRGDSAYGLEGSGGGSPLTGMPLFSFMHQRRSSGRSIARPQNHYSHQRPHHHLQHSSSSAHHNQHSGHSHHPQQQHPSKSQPDGCGVDGEEMDDVELLPLAQLALHTHGHPLILTGTRGAAGGNGSSMRGSSAPPPPTRHIQNNHSSHMNSNSHSHKGNHGHNNNQHAQTASSDYHHHNHHHQTTPTHQTTAAPAAAASDSVSVTSDEGSIGHADNCLPRIIKPRKRRKKDRKPTAAGSPPPLQGGAGDVGQDTMGTIVTLKPYMPMCYNYNDPKRETVRFHEDSKKSSDLGLVPLSGGGVGCACDHCVAGQMFPTPPPSPASSASSSSSSSTVISSSCSSSSEDEPLYGIVSGGVGSSNREACGYIGGDGDFLGAQGDCGKQLVRSLSEPQARPRLHISSSISQSFAGHRDLDIRIVRSTARDVPPMRTRHWSVPAVARHRPNQLHHYLNQGDPFSGSSFPSSPPSMLDRYFMYQNLEVTTPHPPERPWIRLVESDLTKPSCIFTVMCYNVLCDKYATRQMYGYCPSWALEWEYRKKGIMDEIKHYMADIITLQEVETDQFYNFFLPELKNEGYEGIFSPKSRAKHMTENERKYVDGCAIFWRTNKFALVKERLIEFNQLAMANHDGSEDMLNRVMTKDNIGLAALLETKEAAWENSVLPDKSQINQHILVCTAHIHWDPEFRDVKLIQTIMLMSEIRQIITQIVEEFQHRTRSGRKLDPNAIQLLLCGDLNSLPESGVVEFLTKGNVSMDHEDFKGFGYKTCLQKIAMANAANPPLVNTNSNIYTHSFRLSAAYDFSIMAYTNYTYDFKGIIDYIFHNSETMTALGVLGPIDPEWFRENKVMGCPHPHIPSDHFPLLVQLEMRPVPSTLNHPNGLLHR